MSSCYICHWYFWSWNLFLKEAYFLKHRDVSVQVNLQECDNNLNRNRISGAAQNKNWRPAASLSPQWLEIQGSRVGWVMRGKCWWSCLLLWYNPVHLQSVRAVLFPRCSRNQTVGSMFLTLISKCHFCPYTLHIPFLICAAGLFSGNCSSFMSGHSHFFAGFSHPFEHIRKRHKFLHFNIQLSFFTFAGLLCSSSSDIIFDLGRSFCQGAYWLPAAISDKEKLLSFCVIWLSIH